MGKISALAGAYFCLNCSFALAAEPPAAAVASAHHLATDAGIEILDVGGNAFDAAVAVSAALAVVEPASSGLGGGGFWLLHLAESDRQVFIDGREKAPMAASRDMFLDDEGAFNRDLAINGPLAAGIPGQPAGLVHLAENYGRLSLARSLAPAIELAREGFAVDDKYRRLMQYRAEVVRRHPAAAEIFLDDGEVPALGAIIRQPDLAGVLEAMAAKGHEGFYAGRVARTLVDRVCEAGGIWQLEDFARYRVVERQPISFKYRGYEIVTAPPPSAGGITIAQILQILEPWDLARLPAWQQIHLQVEAMRRAYRDRAIYLGDPDFVPVPVELLTSPAYAAGLRASIHPQKATPSELLPGVAERLRGADTTHFSLLDAEGNMVAATLSVNLPYGSGFVARGTGILLNDEMDDFSAKEGVPNSYGLVGQEANAIAPEKRMLSSMTPSFVLGGDFRAALGTPGGSRIPTMILRAMLAGIDGTDPEHWVSMPRIHHQYLPDVISVESDALDAGDQEQLEAAGHEISRRDRPFGNMQAVMWNREAGTVRAASDPRWSSGSARVEPR